jgi:hypothetical protein
MPLSGLVLHLIKVMKKNKTLCHLLGYSVTVTKNPGPDASPGMRMKLAQAVHWHTSFQMSINHVPLQELVDPDKVVELHCVEDKEGDPQELVFTSVREVMSKHKIKHLPLWQGILQNDNGSWKGYHLNGQGCKAHKGVASRWLGCVSAHFRFHLMKRGVTDDSALALIRASFSQQVLRDAINATIKDGKVVSATQAKFDDELDNMMRKAMWVDITKGMELSECVKYEQESHGQAFMLDPSNPEALNFADEQSIKLLNTAVTGGLVYTMAFSASLGETAYMPTKDDDVDSQETDVFEQGFNESDKDDVDNNGVITNLINITKLLREDALKQSKKMAVNDNKDEDEVQVVDTDVEMLHSPKKVTRTATAHSGIPKEMTEEQKFKITSMVDEWMADHIDEPPPPQLAALAAHVGLTLEKVASTPSQRGKKDKVKVDTPAASEGAIADSLKELRFVLSGTWPDLGGGQGLTSGKLCLKSRIEKFGGSVTAMYSCLTNFLVVGTSPGPKKVIEVHEKKVKIIDINQLTKIIVGGLAIIDLATEDYPETAIMVLEAKNIQVQHHPNSSRSDTQAAEGTVGDSTLEHSDDTIAVGDGHSNA